MTPQADRFSWATTLSRENRLYLIELAEDMRAELEMGSGQPAVRLWKQVIAYPELHPGDGIQVRDNYMRRRYQSAQLLEAHGVVCNVRTPRGQTGYNTELLFNGDIARVAALEAALRTTFLAARRDPQPWLRYNGIFFAFISGVTIALAAARWSWELAVLTCFPLFGLLRSLGFAAHLRGRWSAVARFTTVAGSMAAIAQLLLDLVKSLTH